MTGREALTIICNICESEYAKGKRKININKIWNIAEDGKNYYKDPDPNTRPSMNVNYDNCDTRTNSGNFFN